jgi:hypothetical protein
VPGKELTPNNCLLRVGEDLHCEGTALCFNLKLGMILAFTACSASLFGGNTVAAETAPAFVGSQSCASSMCHGGADDKRNQFNIWLNKDFHTRAHATLNLNRSARIAETLKIADATKDARCTVCHNPFQTVANDRKGERVGKLEGVSCETCHNAAENWLLTHTRTDLKYEQKVAAGMRDLKNLYVRANTCVACHQNIEPDLRAAGHPELTFELDGQCVTMPRHWTETNRLRGAQTWVVGQAVALREAAAQSSATKPSADVEQRTQALAWLLGASPDAKAADALAKRAAGESWSSADVRARLESFINTREQFANPKISSAELAQRAERLVLGIDRLLVALGIDRKSPASVKLDQLFKDVQSRADFDPKGFAKHLAEFEATLAR